MKFANGISKCNRIMQVVYFPFLAKSADRDACTEANVSF